MTLHRKHHTLNPHALAVRLSLQDQLDLQFIALDNVEGWVQGDPGWHLRKSGVHALNILERHGVAVSLDEHTGRVTFNPEVIDA